MPSAATPSPCPCCHRLVPLTFHHLIPKKLHRRVRFRRDYLKSDLAQGVYICRMCHNGIHRRFSEMELAEQFASLERILADEGLQRHFRWVARQRRDFDAPFGAG